MEIKDVLLANVNSIVERRKAGESSALIADSLGISKMAIDNLLSSLGYVRIRRKTLSKFDSQKDAIIASYDELKSVNAVSKKFGAHNSVVRRFLKEANISVFIKAPKDTTVRLSSLHDKMKELLISGATTREVATVLDRDYSHVSEYINANLREYRTNQHKLSEYKINLEFFDKIDTEEKAYFLGLMIADGSLRETGFRISLIDEDVIIKFIAALRYDGSYHELKRSDSRKDMFELNISKPYMKESLIKLGFCHDKTNNARFATPDEVPHHLMRHYLRGVLDGDGCITRSKKENIWKVSFIGHDQFILAVSDYIKAKCSINFCTARNKNSRPNILSSFFSGNKQIGRILQYLYEGAKVYMDRKYEKYLNYCAENPNYTHQLAMIDFGSDPDSHNYSI